MFDIPEINYCVLCGGPTERRIPEGDSHYRYVCTRCGHIHYQNPNIVAGTIPVWEDKVLLCRRAIEPRYGKWTLPAGYQEMLESTRAGAERETREEARAAVDIVMPLALIDLPFASSSQIFFLANLTSPDFAPGEESLEVRLFSEEEIPWDDIAFHTVRHALKFFFEDRRRGNFTFHYLVKTKPGPVEEP